MSLTNDLIHQFVKATKDTKKSSTETIVYGTTYVDYDGKTYVKIDGSDLLTPVSKTTDVKNDERVTVMIKDHTATITGNISSPAARTEDVQDIGSQIKHLELDSARIDTLVSENVIIKEKLSASEAEIDKITADNVTINEKLTAQEASIKELDSDKLSADVAAIKYATIQRLEAAEGSFHSLESTHGKFEELTTGNFEAVNAEIGNLKANKLDVEQAKITYANIDFANIGEAAFRKIFAESGLIKDLTVGDSTITGELVGVTIKGDLIEGNTIKADKLVVKGSDGLYYKLNFESGNFTGSEEVPTDSLHGSIITANSITAEKISVKDLVAFDATIGGFKITEHSLYSGVKESAENTTQGIYMDDEGQLVVGGQTSYLKYYKVDDENYALELRLGGKTVDEKISEIEVGGRNYVLSSDEEKSTSGATMDYELSADFMNLSGKNIAVSFEAKAGPDDNIHDIDCYLRNINSSGDWGSTKNFLKF